MYRISKREISSVLGFATIGLIIGQYGPMLNIASHELGFDSGKIGFLISLLFGSSLIGLVIGIIFVDRWGKECFLLWGSGILILGYLAGWFLDLYEGMLISTVIIGVGFGFYQNGINAMAVDNVSHLTPNQQASRVGFFQFFFGVGAIIAPLLVSVIHEYLHNWKLIYPVILLLGPVVCAVSLFSDLKSLKRSKVQKKTKKSKVSISLPLILLLLTVFFYAAFETSTFSWLPYYWDHRFEGGSWLSGAGLVSLFWLFFSISRLVMGKVIERFGANRTLLVFGVVIVFLLCVWSLLPAVPIMTAGVILILALICGCMIPTLLVIVNLGFPGQSGSVSGLFLLFLTISSSLGPLLIGKIVQSTSVASIPVTLGVFSILFLILATVAFRSLGRAFK